MAIVMFNVGIDSLDQLSDVAEGATADRLLGDETEPAFDLIEPRGIGRSIVNVVARTRCQPSAHLGVLVGGVVVDDEMEVEGRRHAAVEVPQE